MVSKLGIKKDHLKLHRKKKEDLAHYAIAGADIEYNFPWGWGELEGIASRGDLRPDAARQRQRQVHGIF